MKSTTVAELDLPAELVGHIHPSINIDQMKLYVEPETQPPGAVAQDDDGNRANQPLIVPKNIVRTLTPCMLYS